MNADQMHQAIIIMLRMIEREMSTPGPDGCLPTAPPEVLEAYRVGCEAIDIVPMLR